MITIILLCLVICYLLFKLNKLNASDSNKEQEVKTKEETKCQSSSDINCIYYEENGFKIVKKLSGYQDYEINGKTLYSADGPGIDYSDNKIEFKCDAEVCTLMNYINNKLTIKYEYSLDNAEDTIYTFAPLVTIVYLKQEVEYFNGNFGTPKITEKRR